MRTVLSFISLLVYKPRIDGHGVSVKSTSGQACGTTVYPLLYGRQTFDNGQNIQSKLNLPICQVCLPLADISGRRTVDADHSESNSFFFHQHGRPDLRNTLAYCTLLSSISFSMTPI